MHKKCTFWVGCFVSVAVWMFLSAASASAKVYSASEYVSFYDYSQTFYYYNLAGAYTSQTRTGYRYLYDYDDPIVRCQREGGTCDYKTTYTLTTGSDRAISRYKVYLPPGSTSMWLLTYLEGQTSRYVVVARLGQPPAGDYDNYTNVLSEQSFLGLNTAGFTQKQLKAGDCVGANAAGILTIATGGTSVASEADGGWLYVILLPISGSVRNSSYSNTVNTDAFMAWFRKVDWTTFGSGGSVVSPNPTPTPTPGTTPTPTPTPGSDCGTFGCDSNATCVNGNCVPNATVPTPTPSATGCSDLICALQGGRCVSGVCVPNSSTPTPTPIPTPIPNTVALELTSKPLDQFNIERKQCQDIDLANLNIVLKTDTQPSGNVTRYSALCFVAEQTSIFYFAQKDILQKDVFIPMDLSNILGQYFGAFPESGSWVNGAFKSLFQQIQGIKCTDIMDTGICFLVGYAPAGDLTQFQGAAFTFVSTP